jgi:hypothetical protein
MTVVAAVAVADVKFIGIAHMKKSRILTKVRDFSFFKIGYGKYCPQDFFGGKEGSKTGRFSKNSLQRFTHDLK